MALTRKMLKAMGIEDDKIEQIIDAHSETVDALKTERDQFKTEAEKLPEIQRELETMKNNSGDSWKTKYDSLKQDFEQFKNDQAAKEKRSMKESAYRSLLKQSGVSDKRVESVLRVTDLESVELNDDGTLKNSDKIIESIKSDWSDFIVSEQTQGAKTSNPPSNSSAKTFTADDIKRMSPAEINANFEAIKSSLRNH